MRLIIAVALMAVHAWAAEVIQISGAEQLQSTISQSNLLFVVFYAPWCGHCKKLHPKLDQVSQQLEQLDSVVLGSIDCTAAANKQLERKYGITGYPKMISFHNGIHSNYLGAHEAAAILSYLTAGPKLPWTITPSLPLTAPEGVSAAVVAVGNLTDKQQTVFKNVANRMAQSFSMYDFFLLTDADQPRLDTGRLCYQGNETVHPQACPWMFAVKWTSKGPKPLNAGVDLVAMIESAAIQTLQSEVVVEADSLVEQWVATQLAPPIISLTGKAQGGHAAIFEAATNPPRVYIFPSANTSAEHLEVTKNGLMTLQKLATQHKGQFRAAGVSQGYKELRAQFGVADTSAGVLYVVNGTDKHRCSDLAQLESCISKFLSGDLPRWYKSAAPFYYKPTDKALFGLQQLSHDEFDTFIPTPESTGVSAAAVLFYRPQFKEYQNRQPALQAVAEAFAKEPRARVAQYNMGTNDPPEALAKVLNKVAMAWIFFGDDGKTATQGAWTLLDNLPRLTEQLQAVSSAPLSSVDVPIVYITEDQQSYLYTLAAVVCAAGLYWKLGKAKKKSHGAAAAAAMKKRSPEKKPRSPEKKKR